MARGRPFASIVVPTRDRPQFVRHALESLVAQRLDDFEVVVVDNALTSPCRDVFDEVADGRFRYCPPPSPLPMHDNWEFGCEAARGEYVAVMIDKTVWLPSTLSVARAAVAREPAQTVSWWDESYRPADESVSLDAGTYVPSTLTPVPPTPFDGREELARRMSFASRLGTEGAQYFRAKICFGMYRSDLLEEVRSTFGRLFPPISPDYTSMASALATGRSHVDIGRPLQLSFLTSVSNGARYTFNAGHARRFLEEIDPSRGVLDNLPIPGLYASLHNCVANDYVPVAHRLGLALHMVNLCARAREDLALVTWESREQRQRQYESLDRAEREALRGAPTSATASALVSRARAAGRRPATRARTAAGAWLVRRPAAKKLVDRARGRPLDSQPVADVRSIGDAAGLAEERYGLTAAAP